MSLALKLMLTSFLVGLVMANNLQGSNKFEKVNENERLRRSPVAAGGIPEYPSAGYPGYPGSPGGHGPPSNLGEPFKPPNSNKPPASEKERLRRSPVEGVPEYPSAGYPGYPGSPGGHGPPSNLGEPFKPPTSNEPPAPKRIQRSPIQLSENVRLRRSPVAGGGLTHSGSSGDHGPLPNRGAPFENPIPNEPVPTRIQNTPIPPTENERLRRSPVEGVPEYPSAGYPGYPGSPGGHGPPSNLGEPFKPPTSNEQQPEGVPTRIQNTPIPPTGPLDLSDQGGSPANCKVSSNGGFIVC